MLALIALVSSLLLLGLMLTSWDRGNIFQDWGIGGLSYGQITTAVYLKVSISDFLTLFSARTGDDFFWASYPAPILLGAGALALTASTVIACAWPQSAPDGIYALGLGRAKVWIVIVIISKSLSTISFFAITFSAIRFRFVYLDILHRLVVDPRCFQSRNILADQEIQLVQLQRNGEVGAAAVHSGVHRNSQGGGHEKFNQSRASLIDRAGHNTGGGLESMRVEVLRLTICSTAFLFLY
jgi:hypothetical protein